LLEIAYDDDRDRARDDDADRNHNHILYTSSHSPPVRKLLKVKYLKYPVYSKPVTISKESDYHARRK